MPLLDCFKNIHIRVLANLVLIWFVVGTQAVFWEGLICWNTPFS